MLALTRKENEAIVCTLSTGEEIVILVSQVNGSKATIAIDAPENVEILREELLTTNEDCE